MTRLTPYWLAALLLPACFFPDVELEGRACAVNEDCLDGYVCQTDICVRPEDAGAPVDGGPDGGGVDGGLHDSGTLDAGRLDAGLDDAGFDDAGLDDAGLDDAGPTDAGQTNLPPAVISVTPTVIGINVELAIEASDPDGTISSVSVDWGDGTVEQTLEGGSSLSVAYDYAYAETSFNVTVTVTDDHGANSPSFTAVVVTELPSELLILYLPFNGNDDDGAGGNVMSFAGVETYGTDRFSFGERALSMYANGETGSQALVSTTNLAAQGFSGSFTVAIWAHLHEGTITFNNGGRIAGQGDWFNLHLNGTKVRWGMLDGVSATTGEPQLEPSTSLTDAWTFYVGVVQQIGTDSALRLYVDGVLVDEATVPRTFANPGACRFYVGSFPGSSTCDDPQADEFTSFPGSVDDVRVYARALRPKEVEALFHEGGFSPP